MIKTPKLCNYSFNLIYKYFIYKKKVKKCVKKQYKKIQLNCAPYYKKCLMIYGWKFMNLFQI